MTVPVARVAIEIAGDLRGYSKALGDAEKEAQTLGQRLKAALTPEPGILRGAIKGFIQDMELGRVKAAAVKDLMGGVGKAVKNVPLGVLHAGFTGIANVVKGLGGLLKEIGKGFAIGVGFASFQSLGRVFSDLVNVIPELIAKGRDYANTVDNIADATGATTAAASEFTGTLMFLGQTTGGVLNMLGQMSRNLDEQEPTLRGLGIVTRDNTGALLNQITILENARHAFQKFGRGTVQANQIAREFGRGGLRLLVDYLQLTDEQAKAVTADLQAQGLILTDYQRDLGETMIREEARFQNALTGSGATIFTVVGPQLRAFFSQLTDLIVANVDIISAKISEAISFIFGLITALTGAQTSLDSFSGSLQAGNAVYGPYTNKIFQLTKELSDLNEQTDAVTDTTGDQRKALTNQTRAVDRQIAALKDLERQQDRTYKNALRSLNAQLDAQIALLDAEERQAALHDRDLQLTRALRDAKLDLFEAQAQLAEDIALGKPTGQSILNIASGQEAVLDAQRAIAEEQAQRGRDQRRVEIGGVKDYIDSIAALLENSEDKKATLSELNANKARLISERAAVLAAGDAQKAADLQLEIEATITTARKAEQEIRNDTSLTALEERKAALQDELAAVTSNVQAQTEARKAEIEKQIADAQAAAARFEEIKFQFGPFAPAGGWQGVTKGMDGARLAGIKFGSDVKTVLENVGKALGGLTTGFENFGRTADAILVGIATKVGGLPGFLLTGLKGDTVVTPGAGQKDINYLRAQPPKAVYDYSTFGTYGGALTKGMTNAEAIAALIKAGFGKVSGGWIGEAGPAMFLGGERGREYVLDHALSERLNTFLSLPTMPMALAPALAGGQPAIIRVEVGGNQLLDYIDRGLHYRRR